MRTRLATSDDVDRLVELIAAFRVDLAGLRRAARQSNPEAARSELRDYLTPRFKILVAALPDGQLCGYLVCRIDDEVMWAESLYVLPDHRRMGVGSALFSDAERLARELGGSTLYVWIHPDNDAVIAFLQKHDYNVLNLIELRRPRPDENVRDRVRVGRHEYQY